MTPSLSWRDDAYSVFEESYTAVKQDRKLSLDLLNCPKPYPLQAEIMAHPAKRKVINAGRQVGKTTLAGLLCLETFFAGGRALYCATTQEQSDGVWEYLYEWAIPVLREYGVYVNESKRIIDGRRRGLGLGRIRVKTGFKPDVLRGERATRLILDECAYLEANAWFKVGAPMLATTGGDAYFISTPNRRNWFHGLYLRGKDPLDTEWEAWEFPSSANPYISAEAYATMIKDMNEQDFEQEILAKFLENDGAVFRNVHGNLYHEPITTPYPGDFIMAVDWGQAKDYTAVVVLDLRTFTVVQVYRTNQTSWAEQYARIKWLNNRWKPHSILVELNSIGSPNAESLWNEGLPIQGFTTTAQSKRLIIEDLALAIERSLLRLPNDPILLGELMAYERHVNALGHRSYSAPSGQHDDTVIALALVWYAAQREPIATRQDVNLRARIGDY